MNIKDMGDRIRDYKLDTITSIGGSCRTKNSKPDEDKKFFNSRGTFQTTSNPFQNQSFVETVPPMKVQDTPERESRTISRNSGIHVTLPVTAEDIFLRKLSFKTKPKQNLRNIQGNFGPKNSTFHTKTN